MTGRTTLLRRAVAFDAVLAAAAGSFTVVMAVTVVRAGWLMAVGVVVLVCAGKLAYALRLLSAGRESAALWCVASANWGAAVSTTTIATFQWPIQVQVALMPAALAAAHAPRRWLGWFAGISLACAVTVAVIGLSTDLTGVSAQVPGWLRGLVQVLFAPGVAGLVVLIAVQHAAMLAAALDRERVAADELRRSRRRVVMATDRAREQIERDLHDGAQARLVAVNMQLAEVLRRTSAPWPMPPEAVAAIDQARRQVQTAHRELRDLAHGIYPAVLGQHGLTAAIEAVADSAVGPVRLDLHDVGRFPGDVEAAVYFFVQEALQNADRHAHASSVTVTVRRVGGGLVATVADDGIGFDSDYGSGAGLENMCDRLGAVGADLTVESAPGHGTQVVASWLPDSGDTTRTGWLPGSGHSG